MEKKKIYIFFTYPIEKIGGTQMYTAGKTKYLEKLGWEVYVFTCDEKVEKSAISFMTEYLKSGGGCFFLSEPPYRFDEETQNHCINFMLQKLNLPAPNQYEIIIESHEDKLAYWAELLAEKLQARHFFVCCNEIYRSTFNDLRKTYADNLDFFYFKWRRNEIATRTNSSVWQRLFNGYKNVTNPLIDMPSVSIEMNPIQDLDFPKIEKILRLDWNICHVGRSAKPYVLHVIRGVGELARRHPDKKINFIMVGNADERSDLINETFKNLPNVKLTLLGDMVPIPRILFSKVDVVCAISQSARFVANEGILTICANADFPEKTPGVFGYDTEEIGHGKTTFSYIEALENVLVKKIYDDKKYTLSKLLPAEFYYEKFWSVVERASKTKEYYIERLSQNRSRHWFAPFPFAAISRGTRVIFFGATEIASDYFKQILCQQNCTIEISPDGVKKLNNEPYCQVLATVDEHPENFDNSVVGFERLKQLDYDAIILTVYSQNVDSAREKILEIVPQMADRIICNLKFIDIYRMKHKEIRLFED